jgi:uncharacterized membrane protein YqgA involved in biofilm formation
MTGLGTLVNAGAIILGGTIGWMAKKGISGRFKTTIMQGIGLSVLIIGLSGSLQGIFRFIGEPRLDRVYLTGLILCLVLGGLLGEALNIEKRLEDLGKWFQNKFAKGENTFAEGFVTASLVYCVGAMAIFGALDDGLTGNIQILLAKSVLDGVSAIVFAATLGMGVTFSFLPVLVYQGLITLLASVLRPWLTDDVVSQMSIVGSVLIMGIGINILEIKRIKVGNMLPAIFLPFLYDLGYRLVTGFL